MAGVTQRTVLPAPRATSTRSSAACRSRYFDRHPRGDLLSRVTNDIDNIGQSLQQTPDPADHVAADDRRRARDDALDQPDPGASISLLAVPGVARRDGAHRRAGRSAQFVAQWASTGALNGHVEEMHTGHAIVKAFGRQREAIETFDAENERLYQASYRAQFMSGHRSSRR